MTKHLTAESIIAHARSRAGTAFLHQGRDPGVGLDCVGLIFDAAWAHGIAVEDYAGYPRTPQGERLREELLKRLIEVPLEERRDADVLLFRIRRDPQHIGFRATHPTLGETVIHARAGAVEGVCEHPLDDTWRQHLLGAFRFPQLT